MALRSARAELGAARGPGGLPLRLLSALVMIPPALAAVWFGAPWLPLLVALAAIGMGWEWARLSRVSARAASAFVMLTPLAAAAASAFGGSPLGVAVALIGALAVWFAARDGVAALWSAGGTLWVALPCVAVLWLESGAGGRAAVLWLFALVWASDVGAYALGRAIGGPRLAPSISPNKTWAGAVGGFCCAALVGFGASWLSRGAAAPIVATSLVVALAAQAGDLAESFAKRKFGAKDSSTLIPGHGGLLDRLDSLLTASLAQAAMLLLIGANPLAVRL